VLRQCSENKKAITTRFSPSRDAYICARVLWHAPKHNVPGTMVPVMAAKIADPTKQARHLVVLAKEKSSAKDTMFGFWLLLLLLLLLLLGSVTGGSVSARLVPLGTAWLLLWRLMVKLLCTCYNCRIQRCCCCCSANCELARASAMWIQRDPLLVSAGSTDFHNHMSSHCSRQNPWLKTRQLFEDVPNRAENCEVFHSPDTSLYNG
jgi:hypothetical protein